MELIQNINLNEEKSMKIVPMEPGLIDILESRLNEAEKIIELSPVASIILSGSVVEGFLLSIARIRPADFNRAKCAPKKDKDKVKPLSEWSLAQLIDVAYELKLIKEDTKKFSHALRDFRNYIHPFQQHKEGFTPNCETARLCFTAAKIAIDQLAEPFRMKLPEEDEIDLAVWRQSQHGNELALLALVGSWDEKKPADVAVIERMVGKDYAAIKTFLKEVLPHSNSPFEHIDGLWTIKRREDLLGELGNRFFDSDIDKFKEVSISVLNEPDPSFELPKEQRYAAAAYGKVLQHSDQIRQGIARGLAISSTTPEKFTNCSPCKIESVANSVIRSTLEAGDWVTWGSVDRLLPILAEVAPDEFMEQVEYNLKQTPSPFDILFSEEHSGITGRIYLTGLLWALEKLAWDELYLVRACVILGELAAHNPGGKSENRPLNSLATILLPWLPRTFASYKKRKVVMRTLGNERPEVAWDLVFKLLPGILRASSSTQKPIWRIPKGYTENEQVSKKQYWEESHFYSDYALYLAGNSALKISQLIDQYDHLHVESRSEFVSVMQSSAIANLREEEKAIVWERLTLLIARHKRFSDAKWAIGETELLNLRSIEAILRPTLPRLKYKILFSHRATDLFEEHGDWQKQAEILHEKQVEAVRDVWEAEKSNTVYFAREVKRSFDVGYCLAMIADDNIDSQILTSMLSFDESDYNFIRGYITGRHNIAGWQWIDEIDRTTWTPHQTAQFLAILPFCSDTWDRADSWLGENSQLYWPIANVNPFADLKGDSETAWAGIQKLIDVGRCGIALDCMYIMSISDSSFSIEKCMNCMKEIIKAPKITDSFDSHHIIKLVKAIQADPTLLPQDIRQIEFGFLKAFSPGSDGYPKFIEIEMAGDPVFFCQIVEAAIYNESHNSRDSEAISDKKSVSQLMWDLLHRWRIVPGMRQNGDFDDNHFVKWFNQVKSYFSDNEELLHRALYMISQVLIHTPSDGELWIRKSVANVLNAANADSMRSSFTTALYNSRGAHWVDQTGKSERDLAENYLKKAEDVENAGYHRLSASLKQLAGNYEKNAKIVRDLYS